MTGEALSTVDFIPPRHAKLNPTTDELKELCSDGYGNRMDRFLACVAYLDGKNPSLIMCRGYYTRSVLSAFNFKGKKLEKLWTFDSDDPSGANRKYRGQGNHNLSVADVDDDGKDEIVYGAMTIDDTGKGLYSTELGHGDALHVTDIDPSRPGLEIFDIQERFDGVNISKWDYMNSSLVKLFDGRDDGCASNNGTKANPCLSADLFGDWREEIICRTADNRELRIYSTAIPTNIKLYTLMHNPQYRLSIAWQNVAYNQPPHTSYYLGDGMKMPPKPNIVIVGKK